MKRMVIGITFVVLICVSGYFFVQKYLLPQLIIKLEKALAQNTSYEFVIEKPQIKLLSISIPTVKIISGEKVIFIRNIKIHPTLMALIRRKLELQGTGNINVGQEQFKFEVENLTYGIKDNTLLLKAKMPAVPLDSYFQTILYLKNIDIKEIKNIEGVCNVLLNIQTGKGKQLKIEAAFKGNAIGFSYQNKSLKVPTFTAQYEKTAKSQTLKSSSKDISVLNLDTKEQLVKDGQYVLATDFKTAEIKNAQAIIKDIIWKGSFKINNLKNNPDMSFNLTSALCKTSGNIKKDAQAIYFTANLSKEDNNLNMQGIYNPDSQIFTASGKGYIGIKTLLAYMNIAKNSVLNTLDTDLKINDLKINYNKTDNILAGYIESDIGTLTMGEHIIADEGKLIVSIQNNNLELKNLTLINGYGKIESAGNITLKSPKPFQAEIHINNYALKKLTQPFIEKDIGNALFSANCSIRGNIKEQSSILGVCKWAFTQGNIGQLKFLAQIAPLINKPELENISFNSGEGTITFKNNVFNSPGSVLISPQLSLTVTGTMTTGGDLNLTLTTEFPQKESSAEDNSPFGKLGQILSAGMGAIFHKIKITGTTQNPKYTVIPAVGNILQKIFP